MPLDISQYKKQIPILCMVFTAITAKYLNQNTFQDDITC